MNLDSSHVVFDLKIFPIHISVFMVYQSPVIYAHVTQKSMNMRPCFEQQSVQLFYLQQQLDSLNGSHSCFGDGSGNATSQKVLHETNHTVRHGWMYRFETLAVPNLTKVLKETQRPSKWTRTPICPNISAPFIARILSDGFVSCQTENQGWINFRGWSSRRSPCSWCQEWVNPGTFKGHYMCYFMIIEAYTQL